MANLKIYLDKQPAFSWSLPVWLILLQAEVDFEAVFTQLDQSDNQNIIGRLSPAMAVPILQYHEQVVWGPLAIGEYLAEIFPRAQLWPLDLNLRATARSIACEMYMTFQTWLNQKAELNNPEIYPNTLQPEMLRILCILEDYRQQHQAHGKFLFGHFTLVDAMAAPLLIQALNAAILLSSIVQEYANDMMALPAMQMWYQDLLI